MRSNSVFSFFKLDIDSTSNVKFIFSSLNSCDFCSRYIRDLINVIGEDINDMSSDDLPRMTPIFGLSLLKRRNNDITNAKKNKK
jgi:hypothetical protein